MNGFKWQYVERTIYIITILLAVFFHFRDKATKQAVLETKIETMIQNQESILNKFKEADIKWEKQAEINGKITVFMLLDAPK